MSAPGLAVFYTELRPFWAPRRTQVSVRAAALRKKEAPYSGGTAELGSPTAAVRKKEPT
jgi:hypothetical protein